jgi:hypothetical protein
MRFTGGLWLRLINKGLVVEVLVRLDPKVRFGQVIVLDPNILALMIQIQFRLKWQQESFHRILNLIGLQKEGILQESEVSAFRSELLETLIKSPVDQEQPTVIRDKLIFLQVRSLDKMGMD